MHALYDNVEKLFPGTRANAHPPIPHPSPPKEKRNDTLIELANKMAIKAIKTKKVIRLNPMPPRERKIIHEIINQYPELDTYSEGKDPKRYIIIKRKR